MTHLAVTTPDSEARQIYEAARLRALKDHKKMVRKFMRGEINIASPCGMDREVSAR